MHMITQITCIFSNDCYNKPANTVATPVVNIKAQIDPIAQPDILQHNDFFNLLFFSSYLPSSKAIAYKIQLHYNVQFACLITLLAKITAGIVHNSPIAITPVKLNSTDKISAKIK